MHMHQEDSSSVSGLACALMPASLQVILLIRMMCDRADSLSQLMGINNFLARHHFTNLSSCCYSCQCTMMVSEAPEGPLPGSGNLHACLQLCTAIPLMHSKTGSPSFWLAPG